MQEDGLIEMNTFWYIDDRRPIANTAWYSSKDARTIGCTLCYLGLKDESRKRTEVGRVSCS